jgi:hypothetical protein
VSDKVGREIRQRLADDVQPIKNFYRTGFYVLFFSDAEDVGDDDARTSPSSKYQSSVPLPIEMPETCAGYFSTRLRKRRMESFGS